MNKVIARALKRLQMSASRVAHSDILTLHLSGISERIKWGIKCPGCQDCSRCLGSGEFLSVHHFCSFYSLLRGRGLLAAASG